MLNLKKILIFFIIIFTFIFNFTSCSNKDKYINKTVNLKWIMMGEVSKDNDLVLKEINKYILDKINAKFSIEFIKESEYMYKVNNIISSGYDYDIMWVSNSNNTFSSNSINNSFADIEKYIQNTSLLDVIPKALWDGARINGKLYGIPTYKNSIYKQYLIFDKEFVDKHNIEYKKLTSLESLDPILRLLKQKEPDKTIFSLNKDGYVGLFSDYDLILNNPPIGVKLDSKLGLKVTTPYEDDTVIGKLNILNSWYNQGIINKDAGYILENKENMLVTAVNGYPFYDMELGINSEKEYVSNSIGNGYYVNESIRDSINVISKNSANISKAVELLNLINSDSKLRNLFAYGIEGKHYNKIGETSIEILNRDYVSDIKQQGTYFNLYTFSPFPNNRWEQVKKENKIADSSPLLGFEVDLSNFKTQVENCSAIYTKWKGQINTGSQNPVDAISKMLNELDKSGYKDIINATQTQLDNFLKNK